MSRISYDPVKDAFAIAIRRNPLLRSAFYSLLDLIFLRSWHMRKLLRKIGDELEEQSGRWKLLDAGTGFGQYTRFILKRFPSVRVVAVDLKQEYLDDCKRYFDSDIAAGRVHFEREDLRLTEREEEFDLILCIDVLEHIVEDLQVLRNMAGSLRPGGRLLMHSPSHYSREDAAGQEESFVGEHARTGYSKEEIAAKFHQAGLSVERLHYTYGWAGHLSWILTVKYPMKLLNRIGMTALIPLLFYYPIVLPFSIVMNTADLYTKNRKGNGIYALGRRNQP